MERFSTLAITTLDGGIDNSQTTIDVASSVLFPPDGNFRIQIDSEYLLVTDVVGDTWTVSRGVENSTPTTHADLSIVQHILTEAALHQLVADNVQTNVINAEQAGRLYFNPTSNVSGIDTGDAVLSRFGPLKEMFPPIISEFTWINQGTARASDVNGLVHLHDIANSNDLRLLYKAAPSTPYSIETYIIPLWPDNDIPMVGIGFMESATGKLMTLHFLHIFNVMQIEVGKWNSFSSYNSPVLRKELFKLHGEPRYFKIENTASLLKFYLSPNGYDYNLESSVALNFFFTTGPDRVFMFINSAGNIVGASFFTWDQK